MDYHPIQGKVEIFQAAPGYRNQDKLQLDGLLVELGIIFICEKNVSLVLVLSVC